MAKAIRQKSAKRKRQEGEYADIELIWQIRQAALESLNSAVGGDFISSQTFIPAGRSFFTTLGRAFMAFDQGRMLDPITIRFGRLFSSYQEQMQYFSGRRDPRLDVGLSEILGGTITWEGERPALTSTDGRVVPFSALSSGQQELLPLFVALTSLYRFPDRQRSGHLLYIEEPEAHLFPTAQSRLISTLAALSNGPHATRLALTTHSPYVLAKLNNLIKAGALETSLPGDKKSRLEQIVPSSARIKPGSVAAYAIVEGELQNVIDSDGLIAADYLDSISGDISAEFSGLLGLEFGE